MSVDLSKIAATLDKLLKDVDLSNTTEAGVKTQLPEGYFKSSVVKAELGETSKTGLPMVKFEFLTVEDGLKSIVDDYGSVQLVEAPRTANQRIYINYVLSTDLQVGFFVSDMLKFQDPDTEEPYFTKDDFENTMGIVQVCDILTECQPEIYISVQNTERKNDKGDTIQNFKPITFARARKLGIID